MRTPSPETTPVVIAGSGRSGTTWFLDVLAQDERYRPIFEPLHFKNVPRTRHLWGVYLRSDDRHQELFDRIDKVFHSRADRAWMSWMTCRVDYETPWWAKPRHFWNGLQYWRPKATRRIVKFIKANLMLSWMQSNFPCRIIYLTRHPCAVLASREQMGWGANPLRFLAQPELVEDYLEPLNELILESEESHFKKLAMVWCIENVVPQRQLASSELQALWVTYEDLLLKTEESFANVLEFIEYPTEKRESLVQYAVESVGTNPEKRATKWKNVLTADQIDYVLSAAERFGLQVR